MKLQFQIRYKARWGEEICLIGDASDIVRWTESDPLVLRCEGEDHWSVRVEVSDFATEYHYRYALRDEAGRFRYEAGEPRFIHLNPKYSSYALCDYWKEPSYEDVFLSSAFSRNLFARGGNAARQRSRGNLCISVKAPQLEKNQGLAIMGNLPQLGEWSHEGLVPMDDTYYPVWKVGIEVPAGPCHLEYKFAVYDKDTLRIVDFETGDNRVIDEIPQTDRLIVSDYPFRRSTPPWRGAGVAIPVFSLRSAESFGIGEFMDLKKMALWASRCGLKMIQTLPVNDTTLQRNRRDSYPYNAVSVFALNPIYLNIEKMGALSSSKLSEYRRKQADLNALAIADYERVANEKEGFFQWLYQHYRKEVFESEEYRHFYNLNRTWLVPYAVFCYLRDKYHTPDFRTWKTMSVYNAAQAFKMAETSGKDRDKIGYYCYLQFHLDRQLQEVHRYMQELGVALKGDIPIGISPCSVDAWTDPSLFNMDVSAGAPPDDFSLSGQNWGFPTYNWEKMSADNYRWWSRRFRKMADYFDAYRIDHILGFFRIWEIDRSMVWGLCGRFNPALPYSRRELDEAGVNLSTDRLVKPYIRTRFFPDLFGEDTALVAKTFFRVRGDEAWYKAEFDTQRKVKDYVDKMRESKLSSPIGQLVADSARRKRLLDGLYLLHSEVLFVRDRVDPERLHPRISMLQSQSFKALSKPRQEVLSRLYEDFFYHRHNTFWEESAMSKLPTLVAATHMLVCGEDLGMVPACVPSVMSRLGILSLEIQRMPKDFVEFGDTSRLPYLSVCTTGTHDMNPLRAWWEEDSEKTGRYYRQVLGREGEAPAQCSPEWLREIVQRHLDSPALWAILPWQDFISCDARLARPDYHSERINVPTDTHNYWSYRMHLDLDRLLSETAFNERLKDDIHRSGR